MRWVAAPLVLVAALGCGKRGDPLPPLGRTPQPVRDLTLAQRGADLEVRYTAPRTTTGGIRLDVHAVEILTARGDGDFAKTALVEVRKVARPVEEIELTKTRTEDTRRVEDTVRREEFDIDDKSKR